MSKQVQELDAALAVEMLKFKTEVAVEYGVDITNRTVQVVGDIDDQMFSHIDTSLSILESQSNKVITLRISSLGGTAYAALAIIGRMKRSKCKINTEGYGSIMSAATLILACGKKRSMSEDSIFMTHQASYTLEGSHRQNKNFVKQAEREELQWSTGMAKRTDKDVQFWQSLHNEGLDKYFNAQQCLELGIIDEIF